MTLPIADKTPFIKAQYNVSVPPSQLDEATGGLAQCAWCSSCDIDATTTNYFYSWNRAVVLEMSFV